MEAGLKVGLYEEGSVLNILYQGVTSGWYPPLILLGNLGLRPIFRVLDFESEVDAHSVQLPSLVYSELI